MQDKFVTYHLNDLKMEGFIAIGDGATSPQPLVILLHDWTGNRELMQEKARYFAKQGFVGFALDLYGVGKRGSDTDRSLNQKLYGELLSQRAVIVPRIQAALDCAKLEANIDVNKIMLVGFCMGGLCALDFARSGAKVAGVVSVHGVLSQPEAPANQDILAKILVLHGHEDKSDPPALVLEFETEMTKHKADWQVHVFGNTYHSFTNPKANDVANGLIFSQSANARTWGLIRVFTDEIFS